VTHIKDAKPEPLAAEREAALREWASGVNRPDTPTTRWWQRDVAQLFATLDAARAETEAVRRGRDEAIRELGATARKLGQIEALAAELVEGLRRLAQEAELDGLAAKAGWDCWVANAQSLIARTRAQGIGEKEKAGDDQDVG